MDFGKLEDISQVDFTLPPDNQFSSKILTSETPNPQPKVYIGPPIWSNRDWVGKIYPSNAKEKDFLYHYTRQFNTIELNVTHYQIPAESTIERWKESAAEGFKFCPKFPQAISHDRMLLGCEAMTEEFCTNILGLGEHLGTTFLQLGPTFEPKHFRNLENYLRNLPKVLPIAVEFRHPNWFSNPKVWNDVSQMLHDLGVGLVVSDVSGRRDVLHQTLTTSTFTLRFVGNELHPTDYQRIDEWNLRLTEWFKRGLDTAYIFVHCGSNEFAPELTKYWIQQLNQLGDFALSEPQIKPQVIQGSLF